MEKIKKSLLASLLAVLFGLTAFFGFAGMARPASAAEEEPTEIGISIPDTEFYRNMVNHLVVELGVNYNLNYFYIANADPSTQIAQQIDDIKKFIELSYDIIIVVPIDEDAIAGVLQEAKQVNITIIVIGNPNGKYPKETIYVTRNYYALGEQHVRSILGDRPIEEVNNICLFYYNDTNGNNYKNGFLTALSNTDFSGDLHEVMVSDEKGISDWIKEWISKHDPFESNNEMVTFDSYWASIILDTYYANGYHDVPSGEGTGIRVLSVPSSDWDLAAKYAETVSDAVNSASSGEILGGDAFYVPFGPGRSQYVGIW